MQCPIKSRMDQKLDAQAELYVVVGQFGMVMSAPVSMQSARDAKAALDAEKYGPIWSRR